MEKGGVCEEESQVGGGTVVVVVMGLIRNKRAFF